MTPAFLSSGDPIADRRAHYAQMLNDSGDAAAAAEVMAQALDAAPGWAAGWVMLGRFHEAAGALDDALAAWRRAAALDPSGALGAQMLLAAHGAETVDAAAQAAYVETLFDQYAPEFEAALVQKLDYAVPGALAAMIGEAGVDGFARALDLGCGTGLMGERLRRHVSFLEGVDLSQAMLAETARKGLYDGLEKGELSAALAARREALDLVTAADVFMYCAALPPIFSAGFAALRPGGVFAFSIEAHKGEGEARLQSSLRFAHAPEAVRTALEAAGFRVLARRDMTIRLDRGLPVRGCLFVAQKPAPEMTIVEPAGEAEAPPAFLN